MLGCEAMLASEPFAVDCSCVVQFCAPVEEVTVAPDPPPAVEPYVMVSVPLPASVRFETVMVWDVPRFVRVPVLRAFCCDCHVCAPVDDVAVAPGPPPAVEPYVIVIVAPPASVTLDTVIVCAAAETVPVLAVV